MKIKKILALLLAVLMLGSALSLAACGKKKEKPVPTYTVTWKNWDGSGIKFDENVPEGTVPAFGQADPTRPAENGVQYVFDHWDPAPAPITGNTTYTAVYREIKTTVTAAEFAVAMVMEGKNFTSALKVFGAEIQYRVLEDGSFCFKGPIEGENMVVMALLREDGMFDTSITYIFTPDGKPAFPPVREATKLEVTSMLNQLDYLRLYLSFVTYPALTYDAATGAYSGTVKVDDEPLNVTLRFAEGELAYAKIEAGGAVVESTYSARGTTVITEEERAWFYTPAIAMALNDENDYGDYVEAPIGSRAGESKTVDAYLTVAVPDDFDPARDVLRLSVGAIDHSINPETRNYEDVPYTNEDVQVEILWNGTNIAVYDAGEKCYTARLTKTENGKEVCVGPGEHRLQVRYTVLKDLKTTGKNLLMTGAVLAGPRVVEMTANEKNGYDDGGELTMNPSPKAGETGSILFKVAIPKLPSGFDPAADHIRFTLQFCNSTDADYYTDDDVEVEILFNGRNVCQYSASNYEYSGELRTTVGEQEVSCGAGTYEILVNYTLKRDLKAGVENEIEYRLMADF